ncbi:hypothetical protein [Lunatimonas lonarensis]|nr:hypothetical protein [Lunatimonas lonarensis]
MMVKCKRLVNWPVLALATVFLFSCEGPMGPPGLDGLDGQDGGTILGEVFEVDATFTAQGEYSVFGEFGFEIFESDKVLVFRLEGVANQRDIWRPLPRTVYHTNGIFSYSYDFSSIDFSIYLEGNFDLAGLEPSFLQNQVFRVLILPADFINARMDFNDMEGLLKMMGVEEADIPRITR